MEKKTNTFDALSAINVSQYTEEKSGLTYLSWAYAWEMFKKACPDACYEVRKNENGLPYFADELGIMVYTSVTTGGKTYEMWLPVMDGANRTMKTAPYNVTRRDRNGREQTITIPAATMTDVNKAIMRCLTKNLAMFGLGLHVYEGEDITMDERERQSAADMEKTLEEINRCDYVGLSKIGADIPETDTQLRTALKERLHALIINASTENELNDIYRYNTWARIYPDVVDWCKERKTELKQYNVA